MTAIDIMHSAGIAHRDVKPANIMLDSEFNIKLSGFSHARTLDCPRIKDYNSKSKNKMAVELQSERPQRKHAPRRLSSNIITRPYRPPEVLL
mmetsp:Transcript_41816/g.63916  ORF Transcript_41816/g.63916 Transcript_41816/m.63916 type:complete len:92 (+) Transcript_41816:485-760(+)